MKIAYYCSNRETVPHPKNIIAANADVMQNIIEELIKRKKDTITLYAPRGSKIKGVKVINLDLRAHGLDSAFIKEDWVKNVYTAYILRYMTQLVKDSYKYDLIHLHTGKLYMAMPFADICKCPVLITIHQKLDPHEKLILQQFKTAYLVSISNNQRKPIPNLPYIATIYHGVDTNKFFFNPNGSSKYLFMSRISPEKGVESAIKAAKKEDVFLNIYGPGEKKYLQEAVLSNVDKKILYRGIAKNKESTWYNAYKNSKALIFPIQWDEPFGLVLIESMASGTPVIAFKRGSVCEIVIDGKTGFLVDPRKGWHGIADAIKKMESLSEAEYRQMRINCRKHVEKNFTIEKMVDGYEKVYAKVIADWKRRNK